MSEKGKNNNSSSVKKSKNLLKKGFDPDPTLLEIFCIFPELKGL